MKLLGFTCLLVLLSVGIENARAFAEPSLRKQDADYMNVVNMGKVKVLYGSVNYKTANPFFCKIEGDESDGEDYQKAEQFCKDFKGSIARVDCPAGEQCPTDILGNAYRLMRKER